MQSLRRAFAELKWLVTHVGDLQQAYEQLRDGQEQLLRAVESLQDCESANRRRLNELRATREYEEAFTDKEPLVSVTIPTWTNHRALHDVAIPSVLAQTYENLEVVVVGDASPPDTQRVVESLRDDRIRYVNLTHRGPYPDDPTRRWYVAGVPAINESARLARGRWIAPLNDDDAFTPDHVQLLVDAVRATRSEVAYGRFIMDFRDRQPFEHGAYPPQLGKFTWQSAIYHAGLRFFEMELGDAWFDRPGDWSLCRRMLVAGVRFTMIEEVVAHLYPAGSAKTEAEGGR